MVISLVSNLWFWIALLLAVLFFQSGYQLGKKRERRKYEKELREELPERE